MLGTLGGPEPSPSLGFISSNKKTAGFLLIGSYEIKKNQKKLPRSFFWEFSPKNSTHKIIQVLTAVVADAFAALNTDGSVYAWGGFISGGHLGAARHELREAGKGINKMIKIKQLVN